METIFYYVKTGKILSKDEVSALMSGYAAPTGTIGIVNKSQRVRITDGVIQNVSDIKETSSIMSQDSVLDVFTEIVNKHNQDVKRGISPKSEIRKDELDRMIREVSDRIERQKNNQKEKENVFKDKEIEELNDRIQQLRVKNYDLDMAIANELKIKTQMQLEQNRIAHYCNDIKKKFDNSEKTIENYENTIAKMQNENEQLAQKYDINFLYIDFRSGFRQGQAKARELGLYMQKYCGCVFSEEDRYSKQISKNKEIHE